MIIPVVMMFNNNYAIPSGPAIYSMLLHADKQHFYNLFIMHNDISSENQDKIRQIVEMFSNASLKFLEMNNKFSEYAHLTKYPVEILYKLCLETQFPDMDKIILTDVDVVFEGDISKEYINFTTDEYFAGVKQVQEIQHKPFSQDITDDNMHFFTGAGYLIMNLKKMREDNIENKCFDYLKEYHAYLHLTEQEILSQVCYPHIKLIHPKNMVLTPWFIADNILFNFSYTATKKEFEEALKKPVQIHYVQKHKPWINPFVHKAELWFRYLTYTPFFQDYFKEYLFLDGKQIKRNKKRWKRAAKLKKIKQFCKRFAG